MIPLALQPLANHLWQSTVFAAATFLLALALRKNRAETRYWLWLAASVKFILPFSLLVGIGSQLGWQTGPIATAPLAEVVEQMGRPFAAQSVPTAAATAGATAFPVVSMLVVVWFCGCAAVLLAWGARWLRTHAAVRAAAPVHLEAPVPVMSSPTLLEPGVFGLFRPVLLLPQGIADRLTPSQLAAILAHELCHVRRRDNLAAAVHMAVEAIFWFHPVVWWIGARLIEEREWACDEEVLRLGNQPDVYAEGILTVCKFYLESPLACASGVTGADLKRRIETIMTGRIADRLTLTRKLLLAVAGITAVAGPVVIGVLNSPRVQAQSPSSAAPLTFEVASIKPANPDARGMWFRLLPGGGLNLNNIDVKQMIAFAYDVQNFQISGGPGWLASDRFDVTAKAPASDESAELSTLTEVQRRLAVQKVRQRVQALLAERCGLSIHTEIRELPTYALVVAKNGPKFPESKAGETGPQIRLGRGQLNFQASSMEVFAKEMSRWVGRPVHDHTGLKGNYDLKLEWTPDPAEMPGPGGPGEASTPDTSGPSIFTAVQDQLGLRLDSQKAPVETIFIDKVEKPSAN